jgi:hypothetical protein
MKLFHQICLFTALSATPFYSSGYAAEHGHVHETDMHDPHHGEGRTLGSVTISNKTLHVELFGDLHPGKESALEISSSDNLSNLSIFVWVESSDGKRLSAPAKGVNENGNLHFHLMPKKESTPHQIVIRVKDQKEDQRKTILLNL